MTGTRGYGRLTLVTALVACCAPALAEAQTRIVVRPFEGPMSLRARTAVVDALQESGTYELVSTQEVAHAAESSGASLDDRAGRVIVARKLRLAAFIAGRVTKRGSSLAVQLTVYDGASGDAAGVAEISAKKPALVRVVRKGVLGELSGPMSHVSVPIEEAPVAVAPVAEPDPEPQPVRKPARKPARSKHPAESESESEVDEAESEPEAEPEPEPDHGPRPIALELGLALRLVARNMAYNDAAIELGESSHQVTPTVALGLRWYPGAHVSSGPAAHVGLEASGQMMYPIDSTRDSVVFETSSYAFGVGLHGRLPLGAHELGLSLGYGQHAVKIADGDGGIDPGVPSVGYGFGRAGLDARFAFGDTFGLRLGAAYRLLLSYGELGEDAWFQRAGGGAVEAELAVRYTLAKPLVVEAGFALWRYFLSLDPQPADPSVIDDARIAGGITDQYLIGGLGLVLQL